MKKSRCLIAVLILLALPAQARPDLCESAARSAAREVGVPAAVMLAIALTETGRSLDGRLRPWPWTANADGQGHWFASRTEALAFARTRLAQGQRSFDLGCFQINWRWHGQNFATPEALLDPPTAARYAARLLADLHAELGSWEAAAGAYHSRTPAHASRYRARFRQILASLDDGPAEAAPPVPTRAASTYPLFSGPASGASLVPATLPAARPLFEDTP